MWLWCGWCLNVKFSNQQGLARFSTKELVSLNLKHYSQISGFKTSLLLIVNPSLKNSPNIIVIYMDVTPTTKMVYRPEVDTMLIVASVKPGFLLHFEFFTFSVIKTLLPIASRPLLCIRFFAAFFILEERSP